MHIKGNMETLLVLFQKLILGFPHLCSWDYSQSPGLVNNMTSSVVSGYFNFPSHIVF